MDRGPRRFSEPPGRDPSALAAWDLVRVEAPNAASIKADVPYIKIAEWRTHEVPGICHIELQQE